MATFELKYHKESLVNEYGSGYGDIYIITVPAGIDPLDLQQRLIEDVIGEDYYYSQRDVWNQIRIEFENEG